MMTPQEFKSYLLQNVESYRDDCDHSAACSDDEVDIAHLETIRRLLKHIEADVVILLTAKGFHHVGVSARPGNNNTFPKQYCEKTRATHVHGYRLSTLLKHNVRFDAVPLMEDFHVTLSLLKLGYPNLVMQDFACGQAASNAPGGCSLYRDAELQAEACQTLRSLHPDFVTVVTKKSKSWQGMSTRLDVRIQWKKALGTRRTTRKNRCATPKNMSAA